MVIGFRGATSAVERIRSGISIGFSERLTEWSISEKRVLTPVYSVVKLNISHALTVISQMCCVSVQKRHLTVPSGPVDPVSGKSDKRCIIKYGIKRRKDGVSL